METRKIPIEELSGYSATCCGDVIGPRGSVLKPRKRKDGYLDLSIRRKSYYVHRLIAETFIGLGACLGLPVNHLDGDKTNNRTDNLEYVTDSENTQHAYNTGLAPVGRERTDSVLTEEAVLDIRTRRMSSRAYAKLYGVGKSTVLKAQRGETWRHIDG